MLIPPSRHGGVTVLLLFLVITVPGAESLLLRRTQRSGPAFVELLPAAFDLAPLLIAAKISTSERCILSLSPTGHEPSETSEMKPFRS
jgi:hypothetical protein